MKIYIEKLNELLERKINSTTEASFIRLDYFSHPAIYLEVAKYLTTQFENLEVQLAEEKYEMWKNEFPQEVEEMMRLGFVSVNQRFTKLRNDFGQMKQSIVLLATESVQDTGGLADFYSITPADMNNQYNNKFSEFFPVIDSDDERSVSILNFLFISIFRHVPLDLLKVSNIADRVVENNIYDIEGIVEHILKDLWKVFGLPNILTIDSKLLTELYKGKSFKLLDSSVKFIKREAYKSGLSASAEKKLIDKFEKFRDSDNFLSYKEVIEESFNSYEKYCDNIVDFAKGENLDKLRPKLANFDQTITVQILGVKASGVIGPKGKAKKIKGDPIHAYAQMIIDVLSSLPERVDSTEVLTIHVANVNLADGILEEDKEKRWNELCIALGGIVDYLNIDVQSILTIEYFQQKDPFAPQGGVEVNLDFSKSPNAVSKINFEVTLSGYEKEKWLFEWIFNPYDYWLQSFNLIPYIQEQLALENKQKLPIFTVKHLGNLLMSSDVTSFHYQLSNLEIILKNSMDIFLKTKSEGENRVVTKLFRLVEPFMRFVMEVNEKGIYNTMNIQRTRVTAELIAQYTATYNDLWKAFNTYPKYEKDHFILISNLFSIIEEEDFKSHNKAIQGAIIPPFHPAMLEKIEAQQAFIRQGLAIVLTELVDNYEEGEQRDYLDRFVKYKEKSAILSGVDILITEEVINRAPSHVLGYYALHGESTHTQIMDSSHLIEMGTLEEQGDMEDFKTYSSKALIVESHIQEYIKTFPSSVDALSLCFINFDHLYPVIEGLKTFIKDQQKHARKFSLNLDILTPKVNYKAQSYMKMWLEKTFNVDDNIALNLHFNTYRVNELDKLIEQIGFRSYDLAFIDNLLLTNDIKYEINVGKKIAPSETKFPMVFNPIPAPSNTDERSVSISQMQFEASFAHSQLVFWTQNSFAKENEFYRVEKVLSLREGITKILEIFHEKARWVVSLDTGLDKRIFNVKNIISFSTGEGVYGELNVAISASPEMKTDIKLRLEKRLRKLFPSWLSDMYTRAAEYCLNDSIALDGIKILKALNPYDYEIHSYLSTLLAVKSLNIESIGEDVLLKSFISLDSYDHWFNDEPNRPDLLELEVVRSQDDETLQIRANLIECKMGKENNVHIDKGMQQLINGFDFLSDKFSPLSREHDRRYWFAQLYRLLAFSPLYITKDDGEREKLNSDLMKILNGAFNIEWKTTLLTYWLDYNSEEVKNETLNLGYTDVEVNHKAYGQIYIQKQLLPEDQRKCVQFENVINEEFDNFADDELTFKAIVKEVNARILDYDEQGYTEISISDEKSINKSATSKGVLTSLYDEIGEQKNLKILKVAERSLKDEQQEIEQTSEQKVKGVEKQPIVESAMQNVDDSNENDQVRDDTQEQDIPLESVRILLGKEQRTNKEIYWEYGHPKLENRHLLITGTSGVGKTYFMQCLLLELANSNISTLIFDYTDGFKKSQLNDDFKAATEGKIIQFNVQRSGFPINPFKKNYKEYDEDEYDLESEIDVAERIAGIFYAVYKKAGIGDQQKNAIYKATVNGLQKYGDKMSLDYLRSELESLDKGSAKTVLSKIDPLIDRKPFATENLFDWEELRKAKGKVYIVQLTGFTRETQVLLTEFILWDIWSYNLSHGNVHLPFPVILDEAQNLDQSETSPSARILTEGRKFGWSGLFATQTLQHPITKDAITRFQNASQKVHFLPPEGDNKNIASFLSPESNEQKMWATKLAKLSKGQCVVVGSNLLPDGNLGPKTKHVIDVTPLSERN